MSSGLLQKGLSICATALCLLNIQFTYANWTDDLVVSLSDDIEQNAGALDSGGADLQPKDLLPLSVNNSWTYDTDKLQGVKATLGEMATFGEGICLRPLVFDDGRLKLYFNNYNTHIVFYGLEFNVDEGLLPQPFFMFKDGAELDLSSGILIADVENTDLSTLEEPSGSALNEGIAAQQWHITQLKSEVVYGAVSYTGNHNGFSTSINKGKQKVVSFDIRSSDKFVGRIIFKFIEGIGLTNIDLFSGEGSRYFYTLQSASPSFEHITLVNPGRFACEDIVDSNNVSRAESGYISKWFMLSLLFVVILVRD